MEGEGAAEDVGHEDQPRGGLLQQMGLREQGVEEVNRAKPPDQPVAHSCYLQLTTTTVSVYLSTVHLYLSQCVWKTPSS